MAVIDRHLMGTTAITICLYYNNLTVVDVDDD